MIYVVTGLHRSFTSGMMRSLVKGWLAPLIVNTSPNADARVNVSRAEPGYDPNPLAMDDRLGYALRYYVPEISTIYRDDQGCFLPYLADGSLTKAQPSDDLLYPRLPIAPASKYMICWMQRDITDVQASNTRAWGAPIRQEVIDTASRVLGQVEMRTDCTVNVVQFADVLADPLGQFTALAAAGWPIDPAACATVPTPEWVRNSDGA